MSHSVADRKAKIVSSFGLEALPAPVDIGVLATRWGVIAIEEQSISSDAMLLPGNKGYTIVVRQRRKPSDVARQRFSLCHEFGHLLLNKAGLSTIDDTSAKYRHPDDRYRDEERLCDQLGAEILMPRLAFEEDCWMQGWSLRSLHWLARKYRASISAVGRRMVQLMPESCLLGVWRVSGSDVAAAKPMSWYSNDTRYGVPSAAPATRLCLVRRATRSEEVEVGVAPVLDKRRSWARLPDAAAQALACGRGEYKRVMVYYYPKRAI